MSHVGMLLRSRLWVWPDLLGGRGAGLPRAPDSPGDEPLRAVPQLAERALELRIARLQLHQSDVRDPANPKRPDPVGPAHARGRSFGRRLYHVDQRHAEHEELGHARGHVVGWPVNGRGVQIRRDDVRPEILLRSDLGNRPGERPCRADKSQTEQPVLGAQRETPHVPLPWPTSNTTPRSRAASTAGSSVWPSIVIVPCSGESSFSWLEKQWV